MSHRRSSREIDALITAGIVPPADREVLEAVADEFAVALTPHLRERLRGPVESDPLAAQYVPQAAELRVLPEELRDPIGDGPHSPVDGIVHRYADRALLMPLRVCPVYCRFCFRRETVGAGGEVLSGDALEAALAYIASTPSLWEIILSGGDPLLLAPRRLRHIIERLQAIDHVRVIRIHSRVPVVEPSRIDESLIKALATDRALYIAVHANHPDEFCERSRAACARLVDHGIPLLSQSVLLRGVNDAPEVLAKLMRTFVENRIKPYYLHQGDLARGTGHFRVGLREGMALVEQLRGHLSGLCQPTYVVDLPGGAGKVPLGPAFVEATAAGGWRVRDRHGRIHNIRDS